MTPTLEVADWQLFLYIVFGLYAIFCAWQGWQHGCNRIAVMLAGIGVGIISGERFGYVLYDLYAGHIPYPAPISHLLLDIAFGVMVYLVFVACAVFIFKSTRKLPTARERFSQGLLGAILGIVHGGVFLILGLIVLRVDAIRVVDIPPDPSSEEHRIAQEVQLPSHRESSSRFTVNLARAMREEPLKGLIDMIILVPDKHFKLLSDLKILKTREDVRTRFFMSEGMREILSRPDIAPTLDNPEIAELVQQARLNELMRHPEIHELLEDEEALKYLKSLDWHTMISEVVDSTDLAAFPHL